MIGRLRLRLVDNWRCAWKWASVQFALFIGLATTLGGYLLDPATITSAVTLLYAMPPEYRWFVHPLIGFGIAGVPIALRLLKKPEKPDGD